MNRDENGLGHEQSASAVSRYMHVSFDSLSVQEIAVELQQAEELAEADLAAGLAPLRNLVRRYPESGDCWFALGGALDSGGRPDEAVPCYERALALSPDAPWRQYTYLQLASSYRNLGRLDDAKRFLKEGMDRFPDLKALAVFLAFVEYDRGAYQHAVQTLVDVILSAAPEAVRPYGRSIAGYKEDLL